MTKITLEDLGNASGLKHAKNVYRWLETLYDAGYPIEFSGNKRKVYDFTSIPLDLIKRMKYELTLNSKDMRGAAERAIEWFEGKKDMPNTTKFSIMDRIDSSKAEKLLQMTRIPEATPMDLSAQKTVATAYMLGTIEIGQRAVIASGKHMGARVTRTQDGFYWDVKDKNRPKPVQLAGHIMDEQWVILPAPKALSYKEAFDAFLQGQGIYSMLDPKKIFRLGNVTGEVIYATEEMLKKAWHIVSPYESDYSWESKL